MLAQKRSGGKMGYLLTNSNPIVPFTLDSKWEILANEVESYKRYEFFSSERSFIYPTPNLNMNNF